MKRNFVEIITFPTRYQLQLKYNHINKGVLFNELL